MRNRISGIVLLTILSVFSCATPSERRVPQSVDEVDAVTGTTEYYRGEVFRERGRVQTVIPALMQFTALPAERRILIRIHYLPTSKDQVTHVEFGLERIANTDVFLVAADEKAIQGRVRFTNGEPWKWNAWAIGLALPDGTAIAGALARERLTADYRLRVEVTGRDGKSIESATGEFRVVTEGDYESLLKTWKAIRKKNSSFRFSSRS